MKRDLNQLSQKDYDLCVVGGGIYGACVAWDATLRGLSVVLIEKGDFAGATSANSLKIIHGGLRYLQHADFKRMRESILEQQILMRISPNLVHPLPVLLPTSGYGLRSKGVMATALAINNLVGFDRNWGVDPQKRLPRGEILSKQDYLNRLPGIASEDVSGGALFYDAQVYHSERLVLSFLRSAATRGAALANYVEAVDILHEAGNITGLTAKDVLTGTRYTIRSKTLVNTTGPWVSTIYDLLQKKAPKKKPRFAKAMNIVTRRLFPQYAVGLSSKQPFNDPGAVVNKGTRLFFVAPWRQQSLIGTAYTPFDGDPDDFKITPEEIRCFLEEVNQACPSARLKMDDVSFVHGGLLPMEGFSEESGDVQLSKHYQIHDHREDGLKGLFSIVGIKYTTARLVAERAVSQVFALLKKPPSSQKSAEIPLHDGGIKNLDVYLDEVIKNNDTALDQQSIRRLFYHYGTAYSEILSLWDQKRDPPEKNLPLTLKAETQYGIRKEMAQKLEDIVFRRTDLGNAAYPGTSCLRYCAEVMAEELGWSESVCDQEVKDVEAHFQKYGISRLNKDQGERNTLADSFI